MSQHKTIIITGTSSGIGFVLAEYFGKKGHKVYGLSRKHTESNYFTSIPTDVTDNDAVQNAIAEVLKIDEKISSMIFKKSDINELKTYLENINFKTILDDGKQKVEQNQTSLDEVYKVACF